MNGTFDAIIVGAGGYRRVHGPQALVISRANFHTLAIFQEQRAIAVELDLIDPPIALLHLRALRELPHLSTVL